MTSFREWLNESKEKYFLLSWYKNDKLNGGQNIYTTSYTKEEIYDKHKNDYKAGNKLEIETISKSEALEYDEWIKEDKSDEDGYIYYWDIKKNKLIEKIKY